MEITEVRIKLMDECGERLQAFCSITLDDCFVIRDLKIIGGASGPFVAMPSRKLTAHCPQCGLKNHLKAAFCNQCGLRLAERPLKEEGEGRAKLYADIAHPINSVCREMIQHRVIEAFHQEIERSKLPGYVSSYDDFDHEDGVAAVHPAIRPARRDPAEQRIDKSHAHSPAAQPRGPHIPPAAVKKEPAGQAREDFGAGIF